MFRKALLIMLVAAALIAGVLNDASAVPLGFSGEHSTESHGMAAPPRPAGANLGPGVAAIESIQIRPAIGGLAHTLSSETILVSGQRPLSPPHVVSSFETSHRLLPLRI